MDSAKYIKQNYKLQTTKLKTRTIGVNTEENYPKCNCQTSEDICPRFILVPCLPYYYPMCTNNTNNCCAPNFNINPNILNQYQFVHNGNDGMKHSHKCEKHSAFSLLHCCSSSNCTSCTNSSSPSGNNQNMSNTEVNQNTKTAPVKKNSRENGLKKSSQDKINEKHNGNMFPQGSCANNTYFEATNENAKQYCDEEMTRYATELLDSQNHKMAQEYEHKKVVNNDEKKLINHLLTPTGRKFSNTITNAIDDSDDCLEDSENEDEISSIEEDLPITKSNLKTKLANQEEEEERKRPNTADGCPRNNFNPFKSFSKPNTSGKSSDLEMLMMLKAFVGQNADKDMNPKLNQLINHLSSQETSIRSDGQIDSNSKKSFLPRK